MTLFSLFIYLLYGINRIFKPVLANKGEYVGLYIMRNLRRIAVSPFSS